MFSTLLHKRLLTVPLTVRTGANRPILTYSRRHALNLRFNSSVARAWAESFSDPSRPDLFYHPITASDSTRLFALSFLSTPPKAIDGPSVLGWLPAVSSEGGEASLDDFRVNEKFLAVLHKAVKEGLAEGVDDIQINGAKQLENGWMHIHDERNVPAPQRIGDPDDIIATVLVEDSKILTDTYQPMPAYRVCTADGPCQLTEGLSNKLKSVLEGLEA